MSNRNPVFTDKVLEGVVVGNEAPMTIQGTLNKVMILAAIMMLAGGAAWYEFSLGFMDKVNLIMIVGAVVGLISGFVVSFKPTLAPTLSPVYAFAEGAFLGGISAIFEHTYKGIVLQAVSMTFVAVFVMAMLYKAGVIKATEKFKSTVITATMSVLVFYLIMWVLSFFHISVPMMYDSSLLGVGLSIFLVILASLNLIIDFDFVEQGAGRFLPKYYEWYGAFGLMVTIVWLYVEVLRLLSRLRER